MLILSSREAAQLLRQEAGTAKVSVNLGKDLVDVLIDNGFLFPGHIHLSVQDARTIATTDDVCFLVTADGISKIQLFSPETNKFYKLYPTADWPTIEISGTRMHRVTKVTPKMDTEMKIRLVSPVKGACLDTCTGLGYTAIGLLHAGAAHVTTVEHDSNCLEIARHNPWSQELFSSPQIVQKKRDVAELIVKMKTASFDRIVHDPPSFALAGQLYSLDFYKQLYRVLKQDGKLYHYTGRVGAVRSGRDIIGEVSRRLKQAGFRIRREEETLGVSCTK
ncbi:methyltransferase [Candidatus Woesearchaeota archaeon]|nr:methyltransferase [Candidatus Woesearchaeota archaeon]